MRRGRSQGAVCLVAAVLAAGCGDGGGTTGGPDPDIAPFVGTWDAEAFVVTSSVDPNTVADLLISGTFSVVIEPSGLYTAILVFGSIPPFPEIGHLTVTDNFVTFRPNGTNPCPGSSEYVFSSADYLTLDGPTCFDFNLDGEDEAAVAHLELRRR